jgi:hypothetical protein
MRASSSRAGIGDPCPVVSTKLGRMAGKPQVHVARPSDAQAITETISFAFHEDPTWGWAFPDAERRQKQYAVWWRLFVDGAMRYPWVLATERCEVASIWIPPTVRS